MRPKKDENGITPNGNGDSTGGHVTLEVIPVGAITHSSPETYSSVIIKVTGLATHGVPPPNMELSLSIDGSLLPGEMKTIHYGVQLAKEYYFEQPYDRSGDHTTYAAMRLSNELGTFFLKSGTIGFTIGEVPAGHITVGV